MPLFPFRSSSVKPKASSSTSSGGLFSKNRNSRSDGHPRSSESTSDPRRRRRPSPAGDELLPPEHERGPQMTIDGSRTRDLVSRPPQSRRGRSPSKRRSSHRGSLSPSYHHGPSKDGYHDRRLEESPDRRRRPSSELVPLQSSPPSSAASIHLLPPFSHPPERRKYGHAPPLPVASAPMIFHQADHVGSPMYPPTPTMRQIASKHQKSSSSSSTADSPRPRSAALARSRHGSRRSSEKSATPATYSSDGVDDIDDFPKRSSNIYSTYKAVKELSKHADKAKEWIEWLNNVNDAPDEIRLLSSKVKIAKDTVSQIQISLEARPDLVEDESGQNLKMQIEEVIDGTSETLKKMGRLLSGFTAAAQQDGTAIGRLEGFWQSFNYKNEGEGQIRAADRELQIQLTELTTLMSNIYARALRSPKMATSASRAPAPVAITATKLPDPTSETKTLRIDSPAKQHSDKSTNRRDSKAPHDEMAPRSGSKASPNRADAAPDITPPVSPQSTGKNRERDRARHMASTSDPYDVNTSDDPDKPYPYASSRTRHKTVDTAAHAHTASQPSAGPPPRISIDLDRTPTEVLLDAAWEGDLRAVAEALKHAPPNACDHQNLTALHFAVERDHMAVAMLLLDRGANVHARADGGCLPLHLAARYASADTVEMLMDRAGADPNARSSDGRTPLHYAARSAVDGDDERREVIRTLRDWGTDPTLTTRKGETPRDVAQKRDHWDAAATLRRAEKKWEQDSHGHTDGGPAQHRLQYELTEK